MTLLSENIHGTIATREVAHAKKKPIWNSPYGRGAGRINQARKQIHVTVFRCFPRQDDSPCRPGAQQ
jgi:hypothetical protein